MTAPVECRHNGIHEHGTHLMYVTDRCRCDDCRADHSALGRRYRKLKGYGIYPNHKRPAKPVREHLHKLRRSGLSPARLAELTGLSEKVIRDVMRAPNSAVVQARTARKVFAVQPDMTAAYGHTVINAAGTQRRVQALIAIGWSQQELTRLMGLSPHTLRVVLTAAQVRVSTARIVADWYDRMWSQPAPESRQRKFALNMARTRGYASPLAWDDDEIDDPAARPHGRQYREAA